KKATRAGHSGWKRDSGSRPKNVEMWMIKSRRRARAERRKRGQIIERSLPLSSRSGRRLRRRTARRPLYEMGDTGEMPVLRELCRLAGAEIVVVGELGGLNKAAGAAGVAAVIDHSPGQHSQGHRRSGVGKGN